MPQFVIEREMPGAGRLRSDELRNASQGSCHVLRELGPEIQWVHSYVTDDKVTCIYLAENEELIREHGRCGGFPVDSVGLVHEIIDPTTAEVAG